MNSAIQTTVESISSFITKNLMLLAIRSNTGDRNKCVFLKKSKSQKHYSSNVILFLS